MADKTTLAIELWLPIKQWPGFQISNYGQIKRLPYYDTRGYYWSKERIILTRARVSDNRYAVIFPNGKHERIVLNIARTVLETFVGPEPFTGAEARHLDDNTHNMRLDNLAWGTHAQNMQDAIRNGIPIGKYIRTDETKKKIAEGIKQAVKEGRRPKQISTEHKRKISEAKKSYWKGLRNG